MELDEIYKNFGNVYTTQIVPKLAPFESQRRFIEKKYKILDALKIISVIVFIVLIIVLAVSNSSFELNTFIIMMVSGGVAGYFSWITSEMDTKFRNSVKKDILPVLLSVFGEFKSAAVAQGYQKSRASFIGINEIKSLNFFKSAETQRIDDHIEGKYKNLKVYITEMILQHTEESGKNRHTVTDFRGLVVKTKLNKNYKGKTLITAKNFCNVVSKRNLEEIKLEDVEFEKIYNVYSDDQIEARYLLDLGFMEKIKQARSIFDGLAIHFAIADDTFYIFVNSHKNYFEVAEIKKGIYDADRFRKVCFEFVSIFKLIEHLKLIKEKNTQ